jgi:transcriptional regulator with XRE-family HTH domain
MKNNNESLLSKLLAKISPKEDYRNKRQMELAVKISELLKQETINRKEFAEKLEVDPSQISRWLAGGKSMNLTTLWDMEFVLNKEIVTIKDPKKTRITNIIVAFESLKNDHSNSLIHEKYSNKNTPFKINNFQNAD